jgi:hypothetical protein
MSNFQVDSSKVGYFVLDNAYANDSAIAKLADMYQFDRLHRRLRCAPHTLNLVGQAIMFGVDTQSFNNGTTAPPILQVFCLSLMLLYIVVKRLSINSAKLAAQWSTRCLA